MAFDTTSALAGMFLWLIFGYLTVMVNCDLQRAIMKNPIVIHVCGLTAFIFLFTLLDGDNDSSVYKLLLQSFAVYALFVMMTKSKWYFVSLVLLLLLADQLLKKHVDFKRAAASSDASEVEALVVLQARVTTVVLCSIVLIVFVGTAHYAYLQRIQYGKNFSWYKLFISTNRKCADKSPDYYKMAVSSRARLKK
jgi:hypothetical protein